MPNVVGKQYTIERRTFLKLSAAAAAAGVVIDFEAAAADGACREVSEVNRESSEPLGMMAVTAGKELLYWIDGPMNTGLPGYTPANPLLTRARLSLTMPIDHNKALGWVESVTLAEGPSIIAQAFYGSDSGTVTGKAPYTVFENLDLDTTKEYKVIYVKSDNAGTLTAYVHIIKNPEPSRFDYSHLSYMKDEKFSHYLEYLAKELADTNSYYFTVAEGEVKKSGYITTPYGVTAFGGKDGNPHTARARILKIEGQGAKDSGNNSIQGDFEIEIEFMHGDINNAHYMRYFLVLDPVGRILGGVRRNYGDGVTGQVLVKRGFHTPLHNATNADGISKDIAEVYKDSSDKPYGRLHGEYLANNKDGDLEGKPIPALSAEQVKQYITSMNILDCPFVTIYTDDRYHAIARYCLRLR